MPRTVDIKTVDNKIPWLFHVLEKISYTPRFFPDILFKSGNTNNSTQYSFSAVRTVLFECVAIGWQKGENNSMKNLFLEIIKVVWEITKEIELCKYSSWEHPCFSYVANSVSNNLMGNVLQARPSSCDYVFQSNLNELYRNKQNCGIGTM